MNVARNLCVIMGLCILAVSCRKNVCRDNHPYLYLTGFDSVELSSMTLKRYERTPDFATYIATDSHNLTPYRHPVYPTDWSKTGGGLLDPRYNYIVDVPLADKTFLIRDIYFDARTEKVQSMMAQIDRCCNVVHYTVNDESYTITPPDESESFSITLSR